MWALVAVQKPNQQDRKKRKDLWDGVRVSLPPPPVDEMNVLRLFYAKFSVGATHTHQWSRRSATDMIKAQEFILLVGLYLKQIPQKLKKDNLLK